MKPGLSPRQESWEESVESQWRLEDPAATTTRDPANPPMSPATTTSLTSAWEPEPYKWVEQCDGSFKKELETRFYGPDGEALPKSIHHLMPYLKEKGITVRPDINEWFYNSLPIPSHDPLARHYIKEGMREPLRSDFVRFIRDTHSLADDEWDFGQDDLEHREDLTDLLHYMIRLSEWNPYLPDEPMTGAHGHSDDGWDSSWTADGLPVDLKGESDAPGADADLQGDGLLAEPKGEAGGSGVDDGLPPDAGLGDVVPADASVVGVPDPPVAPRRHREKKPEVQYEKKNEAWCVKWVPLTLTGFVDFVNSCNGQKRTKKHSIYMEEITRTTHEPNKDGIKWRPIKPGETHFWLEKFYCGQVPEKMTLQQLIRYTKTVDHENQWTVPTNTPEPVRWTIWAIGDMWTKHGTDRPDEVQWWLQQEWGTQT